MPTVKESIEGLVRQGLGPEGLKTERQGKAFRKLLASAHVWWPCPSDVKPVLAQRSADEERAVTAGEAAYLTLVVAPLADLAVRIEKAAQLGQVDNAFRDKAHGTADDSVVKSFHNSKDLVWGRAIELLSGQRPAPSFTPPSTTAELSGVNCAELVALAYPLAFKEHADKKWDDFIPDADVAEQHLIELLDDEERRVRDLPALAAPDAIEAEFERLYDLGWLLSQVDDGTIKGDIDNLAALRASAEQYPVSCPYGSLSFAILENSLDDPIDPHGSVQVDETILSGRAALERCIGGPAVRAELQQFKASWNKKHKAANSLGVLSSEQQDRLAAYVAMTRVPARPSWWINLKMEILGNWGPGLAIKSAIDPDHFNPHQYMRALEVVTQYLPALARQVDDKCTLIFLGPRDDKDGIDDFPTTFNGQWVAWLKEKDGAFKALYGDAEGEGGGDEPDEPEEAIEEKRIVLGCLQTAQEWLKRTDVAAKLEEDDSGVLAWPVLAGILVLCVRGDDSISQASVEAAQDWLTSKFDDLCGLIHAADTSPWGESLQDWLGIINDRCGDLDGFPAATLNEVRILVDRACECAAITLEQRVYPSPGVSVGGLEEEKGL